MKERILDLLVALVLDMIKHIKKMTAEGKTVTGKNDKRMSIIPQPR